MKYWIAKAIKERLDYTLDVISRTDYEVEIEIDDERVNADTADDNTMSNISVSSSDNVFCGLLLTIAAQFSKLYNLSYYVETYGDGNLRLIVY